MAAANPHTVVVLETGNPVTMPWVEKPSAIMYSAIQDDWKSLLVDAGEQRRLGIEVQAAQVDEDEVASVTLLASYQADVG